MENLSRPVVLTCAQPSNQLHLGNYLGAIRNWSTYLDTHECFIGIVDMHAITQACTPADLRKNTLSCLAMYIACGLDPQKCHLFVQSHVTGHTELAWVLGALTPLGQLQRMTQFKDKSAKQTGDFIGSGLLYYPVLQAADILLYNADIVPVGEDQKQHLELTRDIAQKFNTTYSDTFKVPEVSTPKNAARVMSLQDPSCKMSKSDANQSSSLFLNDSKDILRKKVMSAVTDTGSEIKASDDKPGVTNLLNILSALSETSLAELESQFAGKGYADFKKSLAEAVIESISPIQSRYEELIKNKDYLLSILKDGAEVAQKRAYKTLGKVYRKVGFLERVR